MRVLYVSSGPGKFHQPIDRYIHLTLSEMDIDYRFFDLTSHIEFFKFALDEVKHNHDIGYSERHLLNYAAAPLLQAVSEFEPDLVLTTRGLCLPKELIGTIKKMGAVTALWSVDDPYGIDRVLEFATAYDFVFTVEFGAIQVYQEAGCENVFQLPLGAFPKVHDSRSTAKQFESDICFIGSAFANRIELINDIADYLLGSGLNVRIIGQWWDRLKSFNKLRKFISNDPVYAADAAKYYAGAKINLNIHRAPDVVIDFQGAERKVEAFSPNNRTFEIAACGGFQLIDVSRPELGKYFDIGRDIEVFSSAEELIKKIDFYLNDDKKRLELVQHARERCLRDHTYHNRLEYILEKTLGKDPSQIIHQVLVSSKGSYLHIDRDTTHYQKTNRAIIQAVPSNTNRVLDIGCGDGLLGEMLKSLGAKEVFGIELDETFAAMAKTRLDRVIVGDIEEIELPFKNGYFDCIIYDGVLEHLKDPWKVLAKQRRFLTAGGQVVASLPNILYLPVIKELLKGHWRYRKSGILDNAHLRFFTLRELVQMFKLAGYEIESVEGITNGLVDQEEANAFIKKIRTLDIIPESLMLEIQYRRYVLVAKRAKTDSRQGAGLCLVKS